MKFIKFSIIIIFTSVFWHCQNLEPIDSTSGNRSFLMGFTPFPYDNTLEALNQTYEHILQDGDLVLVHFDNGVPWNEALNDQAFPDDVQFNINTAIHTITDNHKIFLTVTPNHIDRETLAHYWNDQGTQQPLPSPWDTYHFDTPEVITAYIKYCKRLIDTIKPDFFAYGIEVNGGLRENTPDYTAFTKLADTVYKRLKQDYPQLPVLMTFQDQSYNKTKTEVLEITRKLLAYSDMVAVSTYPFWLYDQNNSPSDPENIPDQWLTEMRDLAPEKPFVISETGYIAEDLVIPAYQVNIIGTPQWQAQYVQKLLNKAQLLKAHFVCWFVYQDYDLLYEHIDNPPPYFLVWKDNGLRDGLGQPREGLSIWRYWLNKTVL